MCNIVDYLKSRRALVALYLITLAVILILGFLAQQESVYVRYETVLVSFSFACIP